jgi:acetyl-CoA carboxylase carboxyltransferase component
VAAEQSQASVRAAARLSYDDVVDPRDLRDALLAGLDLSEGRDSGRHGPRALGILP